MTTSDTWHGEDVVSICSLGRTPQGEFRYRFELASGEVKIEDVGEQMMLDITLLAADYKGSCPKDVIDKAWSSEPRANSLPEDDAKRGQYPMADGLIDYFPNALAEVSRVSFIGSQKHNIGEPMHWARHKSTDHRNKIARHLVDAGGIDVVMVNGKEERVRHSAYLAWRALANLQDELEREEGYPPSRASRFPEEK